MRSKKKQFDKLNMNYKQGKRLRNYDPKMIPNGFSVGGYQKILSQGSRKRQKVSWHEVGAYIFPNYVWSERYRYDYSQAIPLFEFYGCDPPKFKDGSIAYHNEDLQNPEFDWSTINWGNPTYPWEAPALSSEYWSRCDGQWIKDSNNHWKIQYPEVPSM